MTRNALLFSAAGSGKTNYIVEDCRKNPCLQVLITTYTEANRDEIKGRFGLIPKHVTVQTWFSFLLEHCVRPFQGRLYSGDIKGMVLVNKRSGIKYLGKVRPVYHRKADPKRYYFDSEGRIYSDKISEFSFEANKKTAGEVMKRLAVLYPRIYVDEVQDLAGYDLELLKLMVKEGIQLCLVGDPRQVTYVTHNSRKNGHYKNGKIDQYIIDKFSKKWNYQVDTSTLSKSHRCSEKICCLSSRLYPNLEAAKPCDCEDCLKSKAGVASSLYLVDPKDVDCFLEKYEAVQLVWNRNRSVSDLSSCLTFGASKGMSFDSVLIYPTKEMQNWLFNIDTELTDSTRSKFYVAITRARFNVGFVVDNNPLLDLLPSLKSQVSRAGFYLEKMYPSEDCAAAANFRGILVNSLGLTETYAQAVISGRECWNQNLVDYQSLMSPEYDRGKRLSIFKPG
ncbi:UvrD-helicase domain-containing protein [Pseudoteredinibacter isoporae]|uniref:UvrD-helicase domain-containing protein n=1 Tax=Pseudoteredinibacter isoporae TaxID=570281 RepID=UPI00310AC236